MMVGTDFCPVVDGGGGIEWEEPRFFDDHGEEETRLSLDGLNETLQLKLCGQGMFGLYANGLGGIRSDGRAVGNEQGFEGKCMAR